jgi:hypothetical protein
MSMQRVPTSVVYGRYASSCLLLHLPLHTGRKEEGQWSRQNAKPLELPEVSAVISIRSPQCLVHESCLPLTN